MEPIRKKLDFNLTCCFTGHRNIHYSEAEKIKKDLSDTIEQVISRGITRFICGGALGFDTLAAQAVIEKKKKYSLSLEIAVPCKNQDQRWNLKQKAEYKKILESADKVTVLFDKYVTGCMHFRDAYMVDNSDVLISYYRGRPGGTQYTFMYAEARGLTIINI